MKVKTNSRPLSVESFKERVDSGKILIKTLEDKGKILHPQMGTYSLRMMDVASGIAVTVSGVVDRKRASAYLALELRARLGSAGK